MLYDLAYQADGITFLAERTAALLADEPGLGKTFQAIRACDARVALTVLVIAPASVVPVWLGEIAKFREGGWDAHVVSYEQATGKQNESLVRRSWDVLIVDEAHMLKTVTAKRTKAIYGFVDADGLDRIEALVDRADATWLLTGTPMPNNPSELFPHLRALAPNTIRSERTGKIWSIHQFINGYCVTKHNGFGLQIVGAKNTAKLHRKLKGFMLRRRKEEVLKDLPPLRFGEVWVDGDVTALPEDEVAIVREALERGGFDALREIVGHVGVLRRLTGLAKLPGMIAWVKDWLAGSSSKIVLFAHHRDVISGLAEALGNIAVSVSGSTVDRGGAVKAFQNDPKVRVFIGQITAAGTGITLTAASDLVFVESSWVPAEMQQAAMRIHRIGQANPCLVRFATIAGSIDEDIQRAVARKMNMIDAVIEGR